MFEKQKEALRAGELRTGEEGRRTRLRLWREAEPGGP